MDKSRTDSPMVYWKRIKNSILLAGSVAIISSCTLDDPGNSGANPPLTLHAEQNLSLITLSWEPVRVTGFKEYIILQSTNDIPDAPTPEVNIETTVLKRIDDRDVHSFTLTNTLFSPRLCFKLYTSVDDRFMYSSTLCLDQDMTIFSGFHDRAGHEEGLDDIVAFDRSNSRLSIIDYKNGSVTKNIEEINLSFPLFEVSTFEGVTDVFAYDQSPPRMRKYNYPHLNTLTFKNFNSILFAARPYKQFIFITLEEFSKSFQVLNRSNLNVVDTESGITGNRNLAVFDGTPLVVLEIGDLAINKYTIDPLGKITLIEQKPFGITQVNSQNTTANNDDYYIGGRFGTMVDRNAEIVGSITNGINTFVIMSRFSSDNSRLVTIMSDNVGTELVVYDASAMPSISKIVSYTLPQASYADVIIENGIIYVMGITFTGGQSQTFILKYPI